MKQRKEPAPVKRTKTVKKTKKPQETYLQKVHSIDKRELETLSWKIRGRTWAPSKMNEWDNGYLNSAIVLLNSFDTPAVISFSHKKKEALAKVDKIIAVFTELRNAIDKKYFTEEDALPPSEVVINTSDVDLFNEMF